MELSKLKIKIGNHEFEAEGPTDTVKAQFEAFKELIATAAAKPSTVPQAQEQQSGPVNEMSLDKIMRIEGRIVALTAHANEEVDQAILLVMLGQKTYRNNDSVTGGEIIDGLKQSGFVLNRIDGILDKLATQGHLLKHGIGKASRYRLTTKGFNRAQELAYEVIKVVV